MTEEEDKKEKEDKKNNNENNNENKRLDKRLEPCRPKMNCDWECYKDTGDC